MKICPALNEWISLFFFDLKNIKFFPYRVFDKKKETIPFIQCTDIHNTISIFALFNSKNMPRRKGYCVTLSNNLKKAKDYLFFPRNIHEIVVTLKVQRENKFRKNKFPNHPSPVQLILMPITENIKSPSSDPTSHEIAPIPAVSTHLDNDP